MLDPGSTRDTGRIGVIHGITLMVMFIVGALINRVEGVFPNHNISILCMTNHNQTPSRQDIDYYEQLCPARYPKSGYGFHP